MMTEQEGLRRMLAGPWWLGAVIALVCLTASLLILGLLALVVGGHPLQVLAALAEGSLGGSQAIGSTLKETVPIALCGLAFLIPFRAGFFNIGGQGQLEVGALAATALATWLTGPPAVVMSLALAAGGAFGAAAVLPAVALKLGRGASEVTTTIMINFAVIELVLAMVTGPMKDPAAFFGTTLPIAEAFRLPALAAWGGTHLGVPLTLVASFAFWWMLRRTVFGFHLAALGGNRAAARAAGISVDRVLAVAVLASAALAGLAGGIQAIGVVYRVAEGWSKPWGFVGILGALLGGSPLGVLGASFLLAALETGGRHMQAMTGVPSALVYVLQGLPVLLFLALKATPLARRLARP
jgi:general nucleoside transport system permease protein